jgi:hypothetical protein
MAIYPGGGGGSSGAVTAATVTNTPSGNLASTDVQAALNELQGDINSISATFDPTAVNTITYFDDFNNYQASTTTGAFPFWAIASGTGTNNTRGTALVGEKNRIGYARCNAGSAAGTHYAMICNVQNIYLGDSAHTMAGAVKLAALPDVTNDYITAIGFGDSWPTMNNKIWLVADRTLSTTKWCAVTAKGGVLTTTVTTVDISTSWTNLRVEVNTLGTSCTFYIDSQLVATHTTNIPNNTVVGPQIIGSRVAGTSPNCDWDWMLWRYTRGSTRGTF